MKFDNDEYAQNANKIWNDILINDKKRSMLGFLFEVRKGLH